jgi:hypothetical protein
MQGLRNYSTHRQLPLASGQLSWTRGQGEKSAVVLDRDELLKWDKWTSGAKSFLQSQDKSVSVRAVVSEYTAQVARFNDWFARAFVEGHLPAFDEWRLLANEHDRLSSKTGLRPKTIRSWMSRRSSRDRQARLDSAVEFNEEE